FVKIAQRENPQGPLPGLRVEAGQAEAWPVSPTSDAATLLRTAAVVRHRGHVGDRIDADAQRSQGAHRRFTTRTRALDLDVEVLDALFLRCAASHFSGHLGSERRGLARALEALTTRRSPGQGVALTVRDGDDGVVERGVHVGDAVRNVLADLLAHTTGSAVRRCFSHDVFL